MSTIDVRSASRDERPRVVGAIVLAFASDPMARWTWPDAHDYLTHFPPFVNLFGGKAFDHDAAHCLNHFSGAALWLPPGVQPDEHAMVGLIEMTVEPKRLHSAFAIFEQMGKYHPTEPHWYLPLIGVQPTRQGRGYGSALLRHALERVDRDGLVAYLESTNPANVPLYQRHGFEIVGTIQVDDSPPMYPMSRRARALIR